MRLCFTHHSQNLFAKRLPLLLILVAFFSVSHSQTAITSYSIIDQPATAITNSAAGWGTTPDFSSSTIYTMLYGQRTSGAAVERVINGFFIGSRRFSKIQQTTGKPFEKVIINRHPGIPGNVVNTLFERTTTNGNTLYFTPSYVDSLENLVNSFVCNRGTDNIFANPEGYHLTSSNIERVDMLNPGGISAIDLANYGFLLNDRGGNDAFKVAAVTALDGTGAVAAIGKLVSVPASAWGKVGPSIVSTVLSRSPGTDTYQRPRQNISSQRIAGLFLSFADLGLTLGTTFYGIAVFPADVTTSMDLIHLTNVPKNTNGASTGGGGLDLMAGGGYFTLVANAPLPLTDFTLSGTAQGRAIHVQWATPASTDIRNFELEKRKESNWVTLKSFSWNGEQSFRYTDDGPVNGKNNYRLKLIEASGKVTYSNIAVIDFKGPQSLLLFPNPARTLINLNSLNVNSKTNVVITDEKGRVVKNISWEARQNNLPIDVSALPSGVYIIKRSDLNGHEETISFVKQ